MKYAVIHVAHLHFLYLNPKLKIFPVVPFLGELQGEIFGHESGGGEHKLEADVPHLKKLL